MGSWLLNTMNSLEFAEVATGGLALLLSLGSYALKSHKALTGTAAAAVLCWAAHFWTKGALTSSLMALLALSRILLSLWVVHQSPAQRRGWTALFVLLVLAGSLWTWAGWVSLPATLASLWLVVIGLNCKDAPLRWGFLIAEALWLLNAVMVSSVFAGLTATLALCVNATSLLRYHPASVRSAWRRVRRPWLRLALFSRR